VSAFRSSSLFDHDSTVHALLACRFSHTPRTLSHPTTRLVQTAQGWPPSTMSAPVEGRLLAEGHGKAPVAAPQHPYQQPYDSRSDIPGSWPSNSYTDSQTGLQRSRTGESNGQRDVSPMRDRDGSDMDQLQAAPRKSGGSRRPSGSRMCGKCGEGLTGQFVRALGDTYHLECFTCHVGAHVPCTFHHVEEEINDHKVSVSDLSYLITQVLC